MRISIVIPVFNQVKFIEQCILSILNQHYPDLELIVIDGGSTDGTLDILNKYRPSFHYFESGKDDGIYDAIQKGFEHSTGEIMAWLGSDDMYHYGAFSIVNEIFTKFSDVKWLLGATVAYDEIGRSVYVKESSSVSIQDYILKENKMIQQESVFWRRELWNQSGATLLRGYKYAGDQALWAAFLQYEQLYTVNALLGGFRHRDGQTSKANWALYVKETTGIRFKLYLSIKKSNKRIGMVFRTRKYLSYVPLLSKKSVKRITDSIFNRKKETSTSIEIDLETMVFSKK
jgi:glycosyltransferase involved in cell wall biosynthesis